MEDIDGKNCSYLRLEESESERISFGDEYFFLLINPRNVCSQSKSLLQEVLNLYKKELPAMNFAANTGKESMFLERSVLNGKYCSLLLLSNFMEGPGKVIAAVTYQIIPADTQCAEIPLAAVNSNFQRKGIGRLLYIELRKRLCGVGICTIFCWGDKESEGFWLKLGFISIAEVDAKGRARRLPIKSGIRKALCFPGGSTLMVSHLNKDTSSNFADAPKLTFSLKSHEKSKIQGLIGPGETFGTLKAPNQTTPTMLLSNVLVQDALPKDDDGLDGSSHGRESIHVYGDLVSCEEVDHNNMASDVRRNSTGADVEVKCCSCSVHDTKKRFWEASLSSLKSKKVKGSHQIDCQLDSNWALVSGNGKIDDVCFVGCSLGTSRHESSAEVYPVDLQTSGYMEKNVENCRPVLKEQLIIEPQAKREGFRIMLMNIADDTKKTHLTKIIEDLGGAVTSDGSISTHVVTGKARKTLNFCTALCSGAWIVSPGWLKESFHESRFVDESPFILEDADYLWKYRTQLKSTILRAKARPRALLKGYGVYLAPHVQPTVESLSTIVRFADGKVIHGLDEVTDASKTIFVACEEDMEEALLAVKEGIWTFSSEWFMNCIMRQELDFEAPQFAESL